MYQYIDVLRGVAILLVLLLHCSMFVPFDWPALQFLATNGGKGVQLFYIVSALTLTMSWCGRGSDDKGLFYIRRFFRIAPLFYLAIIVYLLTNDLGPQAWAPEGIKTWQVVATMFFVHGFHPYAINSVVPGGWSIAVEVSFYALFPWIIAYCSNLRRSLIFFILAVATFYIGRVVLIRMMSPHFPESSQYLVQDFPYRSFLGQLPIFVLGICVYHVMKLGARLNYMIGAALTGAGVVILALAFFVDEGIFKKLAENSVLSGIYLSGLVILIARLRVKSSALEFVGKISYGSYLSNIGIIWLVNTTPLPKTLSNVPGGGLIYLAIICLAVFFVAHILRHLIEEPGIQFGKRVAAHVKGRVAA